MNIYFVRCLAALLVLITLSACTRNPTLEAQLPTLAVIASAVVTTTPSDVPLTIAPTNTVTDVPTALPTDTPQPTATTLPTHTETPVPSATPEPPTGLPPTAIPPTTDLWSWIVITQVSPFDDTVTWGVVREADSPVNTWLGETTPTLFFRCEEGDFRIFVSIGARLENAEDLMDQVHVMLRYDREPTIDAIMRTMNIGSGEENGAGFADVNETLDAMLTHDTLAFGFTPYNSGFTYTTFTLTGLREALEPVIAACPLSV